jgi:hypothetical protein
MQTFYKTSNKCNSEPGTEKKSQVVFVFCNLSVSAHVENVKNISSGMLSLKDFLRVKKYIL